MAMRESTDQVNTPLPKLLLPNDPSCYIPSPLLMTHFLEYWSRQSPITGNLVLSIHADKGTERALMVMVRLAA